MHRFYDNGVIELNDEHGDIVLITAGEVRVPAYEFRTSGAEATGWTIKQDMGKSLTITRQIGGVEPPAAERNEHTSPEIAIIAAKIMRGAGYSHDEVVKLAASALTQTRDR